MKELLSAVFICWATVGLAPGQNVVSLEAAERSRLLGVQVKEFSAPQGVSGFDEMPDHSLSVSFAAQKRPLTGPTPVPGYEQRKFVKARALDGSIYEGYNGRFSDRQVLSGPALDSSNVNPSQHYETHLGYGYNPSDVFIGKRERGKIRTSLFFRDVGSHDTAPYHFAIDSRTQAHLIVADVNISDNNELNVYSLIGDLKTGKWIDAVMLDKRGFTSSSRPWAGVSSESIHLLWDWGNATFDKENPGMGLFYVDWTPKGYGRKVRVIKGLIEGYDAAVDPKTGRMLVVAVVEKGIYVASRTKDGVWFKPTQLRTDIPAEFLSEVSIHPIENGNFVIRMSGPDNTEWRVRLR